MQAVDCVVQARWIAPIEPAGLLEHHALAIHGGRIVECLPAEAAARHYAPREHVSRPQHLIVPGFVNAEVDLAATLWRGVALAGPARFAGAPADAGAEALADSVLLGLAEQVAAGITMSLDRGTHPQIVARVAASLGQPVVLGLAVGSDAAFSGALALHDEYRDHPLVRTAFSVADSAALDDAALRRLRVLADQLERPVVLEAGEPDIARLRGLGLWNAGTVLAPRTPLPPELVAAGGVSLLATPAADLSLGRPPLAAVTYAAHGVNVALGSGRLPLARDACDGMRLLARLAACAGATPPLRPEALLRVATWGGARALGLEELIGSLAAGRRADFVCFDLSRPASTPVLDPLAALLACAGREAITDVYVGGRAAVADGRLRLLDVEDLGQRVSRHQAAWLASHGALARQ